MKYLLLLFLSPSLLFSSASRLEMMRQPAGQEQQKLEARATPKFESLLKQKFDFSDYQVILRTIQEIKTDLEHLLQEAEETKDQQKIEQIRKDFFIDAILMFSINNFARIYRIIKSDQKKHELITILPLVLDERTNKILGYETQKEINRFIEEAYKEYIDYYILAEPNVPREKLNDYLNAVMQGFFTFYPPNQYFDKSQKLKENLEKIGLQNTRYYQDLILSTRFAREKLERDLTEKLLNLHNDLVSLHHVLSL